MFTTQKQNHDPQPYQVWTRQGKSAFYAGNGSAAAFDDGTHFTKYAPRSYYDNNPNPMLVAFREALEYSVSGDTMSEIASDWLDQDWPKFLTEQEVTHARKVLTRLAVLA